MMHLLLKWLQPTDKPSKENEKEMKVKIIGVYISTDFKFVQ